MTVPELRLGDTTWADLMELARQRIPDASAGHWTLHAPVDPGITVLELMAWLLEQRLFLLDQVPDTLVAALLRLLGLAPPLPAVPATTVLALTAGAHPAIVPAGTEVGRVVGGDRIILSTEADLAVWPSLRLAQVIIDGRARSVPLDPANPPMLTGDASFVFEIGPGTVPSAWLLSLYLDVGDRSRSELGWFGRGSDITVLTTDGERHTPVAPPCRFEWRVGRGAAPTLVSVKDGTEGWRHPGVVQVPVPSTGGQMLTLSVNFPDGQPTIPSGLRAIASNAVIARHRRRVVVSSKSVDPRAEDVAEVIAGWLALPGQELPVRDAAGQGGQPLDRLVDDPRHTSLDLLERDGKWHAWTVVGNLGIHRRHERVLAVDREAGLLRFGDGIHGRIPRPATAPTKFRLEYALGGGAIPEVGPNLSWTAAVPGLEATNVVSLNGGRDPESIGEVRARAARSLGQRTRAVTADDVEAIVSSLPGLEFARVHVAPGVDRRHPGIVLDDAVSVFCVPAAPRARAGDRALVPHPEPDPPALEAARKALEQVRLATSFYFVEGPAYRAVDLRVVVTPDSLLSEGRDEMLIEELRAFLDPLSGWRTGEGWPFGQPLRPADLIAPAQVALGWTGEVISVGVGIDGRRPETDCAQVDILSYELPRLNAVSVERART